MTRSELISQLASRTQLPIRDCDLIVRTLTDIIQEQIAQGEKITLSGFGTFERRRRKATIARDPQTRDLISIAEQFVATFRAGSALKEAVKGAESIPEEPGCSRRFLAL